MKKTENIIGFAVLILGIVLGYAFLKTQMLFFRWMIGIGIGYVLTRAFFGFAGSVNRAFRTGSTKLMRTLMLMFTVTAILTASFLIFGDPKAFKLSVHPINLGLVLGGLLFGFGMSLCSCCASGSLTDIVTGLPRAAVTLFFMCLGVFLGFPFQAKASWVKDSVISTGSHKGVFIPDWFSSDGKGGYLGAILVTVLFASIVSVLSYMYERKRKNENSFSGVGDERAQDEVQQLDTKNYKFFSKENYEHIFSKPWSLGTGAFAFAVLFTLLMGVTKSGWGVSTPFGFWFGKLLYVFGVSAESLAEFTGKTPEFFSGAVFANGGSVQDIGIIFGTLVCLLLAGTFTKTFKSELKITFMDVIVFAVGGFTMGLGTRLANGCNAGALYTPIANFSLSGWLYLIVVTSGGILGNILLKKMKRIG
ncbi:YeeE/YedE family protein [Treponema pedis]|nr:YeeE/YedE family protein [Treponema pedis]QOW60397.1 YeeE/YedE family protein [Treponema pedis]QSI05743.1 YeeE/YedE family protein [Treponema pedis]